jgi:uncharacterized protein (DUF1015 family)
MATIKPFRGTYYNPATVKIDKVITQPYDKIDSKLYQTYIKRDPYNAVRLILKGEDIISQPDDDNPYQAQAQLLDEWTKKSVFVQDSDEAIYSYSQEFLVYGHRKKREAFIALGLLENYGEGQVYPHEETLSKPKADRLKHLRAMQAQFGLIFMLYEDPEHAILELINSAVSAQKSLFDFTDHDYSVQHKIWSIKNQEFHEELSRLMKNKKLLIADGHHRYETALAFRDEMRKKQKSKSGTQPFDYAMMAFVNLYDKGLEILPTHRLVNNVSDDVMMNLTDLLRKDFRIERIQLPGEHRDEFIHEKMQRVNPNHHVIGLFYGAGEFVLLHYLQKSLPQDRLKINRSEAWRSLDVAILHTLILRDIFGIQEEAVRNESNLSYCREIDEALEAVNKGRAQLAFLLNPTKPEDVRDVAFGLERMPQKSTDFYPKLMTGLLLNVMDFSLKSDEKSVRI